MTVASIWAPAQPEVFVTGACQIAECGALDDPQRWRVAWVFWMVGAVLTLAAVVVLARPRPDTARFRVALSVLILISAPVIAFIAVLVSWASSAQGFATVQRGRGPGRGAPVLLSIGYATDPSQACGVPQGIG